MTEIRIRCRENGPFLVEGPFTLVDPAGNTYKLNSEKPAIALCRCGQSKNRPFCDGTHRTAGFESNEVAPEC
jgi:CDGSH-type Zn-finger protein